MQYFTQVGRQLSQNGTDAIDSGHERLEAQERTAEGCAGSGRRICMDLLCSCRFLPILLTANSCSHHHFEKHLERKLPFDTSSNHQSPQSLWHRQMKLQKTCMEDFTKRRPQLGPNFLGCNKLQTAVVQLGDCEAETMLQSCLDSGLISPSHKACCHWIRSITCRFW